MRTAQPFRAILATTVLSFGASCGDPAETEPPPSDGVTYSGTITQAVLGTPIAGAQICIAEPPGDCVVTASDGSYSLPDIPKSQRVEIQVTADNFVSALGVFEIKDVDREDINASLFDELIVTGLFTDAGFNLDLTQGTIGISLYDSDVAHGASGYELSLSPSEGEGPVYASTTQVLPDGTETTDGGGGVFFNLPEGEYTVTAAGPGECTTPAIASDGPLSWPARVRPGFLTYIFAQCPDGSDGGGGAGGAGGEGGTGGTGGV